MFEEIYAKDYLDFYDPDECLGDLGEKWCNFKWHIYNLQLHTKERIQSPVFTTRLLPDTHWYLEVKLSFPGDLRRIDITLNRLEEHKRITLVLDVIYKVICNEKIGISSKKKIQFSNELPNDSINTFTELFHKSKTNCLTIECKLRPNKKMIRNVFHYNVDKDLLIRLRRRLLSSELFDTIIRVGDNYRLRGHIDILHARLPLLLEKCLAPSKESGKNIIDIDDLPVSVVKEMLKYAYTGQAYVDLESASISKDVLISYSKNFWKSCCWEDHPVAKTFFTYEKDTLSWHLKDVYKKSNLGSQNINLPRHFLSEFTFSLDVDETENHGKWLTLRLEFLGQEMPKPTVVSCKSFLVNRKGNETLGLGETETLLQSNKTKGQLKLCPLSEVQKGEETFCTTDNSLILQTDLKFCFGSYKSSIENVYVGKFDRSRCTSCLHLGADMAASDIAQNFCNLMV